MTEATTTARRPRPAAVLLTPAAEARIADLMARAPEGAIGVRLSTPRRGCSGLAYSVDYVAEAQPFDEKIGTPGGDFYIDGAVVLANVRKPRDLFETLDALHTQVIDSFPDAIVAPYSELLERAMDAVQRLDDGGAQ
jgi:iron-sulfur cluster assembly protein